jgi:flagellar motor switch protein FliN/FliY
MADEPNQSDQTPDPQDAVGRAQDAAEKTAGDTPGSPTPGSPTPGSDATPFRLRDLATSLSSNKKETLGLLSDVQLQVRIELGRTRMYVEDVLQLGDGAVVELDKLAGDPVDVFVNDRHVARGEVLVLNDSFCVRISEILDPAAERAG